MKRLLILSLFLVLTNVILSNSVYGLKDPSQVYCEALGYVSKIISTPDGESGVCELPTGAVDAWKFLKGEIATEYSYCAEMGYDIKTVNNEITCLHLFSDKCAVCVLENGTEVEVTELMGLSFEETVCGDGLCGFPENYNTCPDDCYSGSYDGYCDGVSDEICDQDCIDMGTLQDDEDCQELQNNCGDGECDVGETRENCCIDCACQQGMECINNECVEKKCGNGKCEPEYNENPSTCLIDCPVSSGSSKIFIYVIIGIVVIGLITFIIIKSRRAV